MRYFKHLIPLGRAILIQYEPIHRLEHLASAQEKAELRGVTKRKKRFGRHTLNHLIIQLGVAEQVQKATFTLFSQMRSGLCFSNSLCYISTRVSIVLSKKSIYLSHTDIQAFYSPTPSQRVPVRASQHFLSIF